MSSPAHQPTLSDGLSDTSDGLSDTSDSLSDTSDNRISVRLDADAQRHLAVLMSVPGISKTDAISHALRIAAGAAQSAWQSGAWPRHLLPRPIAHVARRGQPPAQPTYTPGGPRV
jgi:hypothetical protein